MTDKTCGTNTAEFHGAIEEACKRYRERTDSVEHVARDMYRLMTCMAHYECHNSDCECCIDTDCQVKEVFGYRLEALGVIVRKKFEFSDRR